MIKGGLNLTNWVIVLNGFRTSQWD